MISGGHTFKKIEPNIYKTEADVKNQYMVNKAINYKLHRIMANTLERCYTILGELISGQHITTDHRQYISIKDAWVLWSKLNPNARLSHTAFRYRCNGTWSRFVHQHLLRQVKYIKIEDVPLLKYEVMWVNA